MKRGNDILIPALDAYQQSNKDSALANWQPGGTALGPLIHAELNLLPNLVKSAVGDTDAQNKLKSTGEIARGGFIQGIGPGSMAAAIVGAPIGYFAALAPSSLGVAVVPSMLTTTVGVVNSMNAFGGVAESCFGKDVKASACTESSVNAAISTAATVVGIKMQNYQLAKDMVANGTKALDTMVKTGATEAQVAQAEQSLINLSKQNALFEQSGAAQSWSLAQRGVTLGAGVNATYQAYKACGGGNGDVTGGGDYQCATSVAMAATQFLRFFAVKNQSLSAAATRLDLSSDVVSGAISCSLGSAQECSDSLKYLMQDAGDKLPRGSSGETVVKESARGTLDVARAFMQSFAEGGVYKSELTIDGNVFKFEDAKQQYLDAIRWNATEQAGIDLAMKTKPSRSATEVQQALFKAQTEYTKQQKEYEGAKKSLDTTRNALAQFDATHKGTLTPEQTAQRETLREVSVEAQTRYEETLRTRQIAIDTLAQRQTLVALEKSGDLISLTSVKADLADRIATVEDAIKNPGTADPAKLLEQKTYLDDQAKLVDNAITVAKQPRGIGGLVLGSADYPTRFASALGLQSTGEINKLKTTLGGILPGVFEKLATPNADAAAYAKALDEAIQTKGKSGVFDIVKEQAAIALRADGQTDERIINRQATQIANSITDTIVKGGSGIAKAVSFGVKPEDVVPVAVQRQGLGRAADVVSSTYNPLARGFIGIQNAISDRLNLGSAPKATVLTKEAKDLGSSVQKAGEAHGGSLLSDVYKVDEHNIRVVDANGPVVLRKAVIQAVAADPVTLPDGTVLKTTKFVINTSDPEAVAFAKKYGLTDAKLNDLNKNVAEYETWLTTTKADSRAYALFKDTGNYFDQSKYVFAAVENFLKTGARGVILEALPGVGKTDMIMGMAIFLQAKMTTDPQFIVAPSQPLMKQFLQTNEAYVEFLNKQLGGTKDHPVVMKFESTDSLGQPIDMNDPVIARKIANARVIVGSRDIAFQLEQTDTAVGLALRSKWKQSYVHGDESHQTFNTSERYQLTQGRQINTLQSDDGQSYQKAIDAVRKIALLNDLIVQTKEKQQVVRGILPESNGKGGFSVQTEYDVLRQWIGVNKNELPDALKQFEGKPYSEADRDALIKALNEYTSGGKGPVVDAHRNQLSVINTIGEVLSKTPGLSYGMEADPILKEIEALKAQGATPEVIAAKQKEADAALLIAPRENDKVTGRRYQSVREQMVYNTVGADILSKNVRLEALTYSTDSKDINYGRLLSEAKGSNHYTGTPPLIERFFALAYGIKNERVSESAIDLIRDRMLGNVGPEKAGIYTALDAWKAKNPTLQENWIFENTNGAQSNVTMRERVGKLIPEGTAVYRMGANGEFEKYRANAAGELVLERVFADVGDKSARDLMNADTKALDDAGQYYAKFYDFGAHTGVDTKTPAG